MACCCSYLLQHGVSELLQRGVCSEWSVESLWAWPTLIIFHSIFDTIGESYRPFVLTLLLVMCQNLALTHPNFHLRLGLLSTEKPNKKQWTPSKQALLLLAIILPLLLFNCTPSLRPLMDSHWRRGFHEMQLFWRYSRCHTKRYHSQSSALCLYFGRTYSCFIDGPVAMICSS